MATVENLLALIQSEIPPIHKNRTAKMKSFSYKYADLTDILAAVMPVLQKHGVSISQSISNKSLITTLVASQKEESLLLSEIPFVYSESIAPQEMGSLLTYYRRYGLCMALGIAADEDDDGAMAENKLNSTSVSRSNQGGQIDNTPSKATLGDLFRIVDSDPPPWLENEQMTNWSEPLPPQQAIEPKDRASAKCISDAQRKRLFAISKKANWTDEDVRALVQSHTGQGSTSKIPWQMYDSIWQHIEKHAK